MEPHLLPGVAYDLGNGTVGETGRAIKWCDECGGCVIISWWRMSLAMTGGCMQVAVCVIVTL